MVVFENCLPVTAAKLINKCSLFILSLGVILRLELKPIGEQKVEKTFLAPLYAQAEYYLQPFFDAPNHFQNNFPNTKVQRLNFVFQFLSIRLVALGHRVGYWQSQAILPSSLRHYL